jgi:hypothetical protein
VRTEAARDHICNYRLILHKCNVGVYRRPSSNAGTMPCTPPPHFRASESTNQRPPPSLHPFAEIYLTPAHNHPMGSLHAHEPPAQFLPLKASQKPTPHPLYPQGVCFQPSAGSPIVQNQQLTERVHRSDEQNVVVFRSVFGPIRGYFAPFLPFFAGLRRPVRGGTAPSRSTRVARRERETQRGLELNYPSWLTFTCNAAKSTVPNPRAAAISR